MVSAVVVANAPVVINNHLLLVKILTIAKTIVARTIDATTRNATLLIALEFSSAFYTPNAHISAMPYLPFAR